MFETEASKILALIEFKFQHTVEFNTLNYIRYVSYV
jgi:hypothetical protein